MKKDIKKIVANALNEIGDIEFVKAVYDRLARSEGNTTAEPLKTPLFAMQAKR